MYLKIVLRNQPGFTMIECDDYVIYELEGEPNLGWNMISSKPGNAMLIDSKNTSLYVLNNNGKTIDSLTWAKEE